MRLWVICVFGIVLGGQALAGAWPREHGAGFLSFNVEFTPDGQDAFTSLYAEYGLHPRITAGIDLGFSDDELYKSVVFTRIPLIRSDAVFKLAIEIGLGITSDEVVIRPGVHFGQGFELQDRSGWWSVESRIPVEIKDGGFDVSTDFTFGLNLDRKRKLILQLQSGDHPMDPDYLNFVPSLVIQKHPGLHLEMGLKTGLKDRGNHAVKLGFWREF